MSAVGAATERFESLIRRVFTIALLAISFEIVVNFYVQFDLLRPGPALTAISLLLISQLGLVAAVWLGRGGVHWITLHSILVLLILVSWPLQVGELGALSFEFKPWVWWALGIASIGAAIAWRNPFAWVFIFANPLLWFSLSLQPVAGSLSLADSLRDSAYLLLFPAALAALIALLRSWVESVDQASADAIASAITRASTDASERERQRIDALVHDQVLHSLLSAAAASGPAEQLAAANLARESISKLEQIDTETDPLAPVSASGLFRALRKAALRLSSDLKISLSTSAGQALTAEAADALTSATIQALENALQHADASAISLSMEADLRGVVISVGDNGRGFAIDRVPRNRIGLQTSIIRRVESVGGAAKIDSRPGAGTTVTIRWLA